MALSDLINEPRGVPIMQVRVNGVLLSPSNPNDDTGTPGVLSLEYDDTVARIDMNNCPTWMLAGQPVTIDLGLRVNGISAIERQWTGFLLALPGEDPGYLRDKVIVKGATRETGTPPDNIQEQITAAATLTGADIQPPLPAGVHIEHEVPNDLVWTSERASWMAVQYLQRFGQVPRYPTGEPNKQSIICAGALYKADRAYQLSAIDIGGITDEQAIELILALVGISDYSLIEPEPGWYTLAADAVARRGRPLDMLQQLMELGQLQPVHTKAGILLMRQVKWGPAPTAAWEYDTTDQTKARILSATGELEVIWNPDIQKYSTGSVNIPYLQSTGRYFVESVRHVWPGRGMPVTRIRAMGGSRLGGTVSINPVATFTYTAIRETFGSVTNVIASFDASGSFDPDGSIVSYAWSDNQTTTPEIATFTGTTATVRGDTTAWTGSWDVTLTVTDGDGLTHAVTISIPYENTDEGLTLPATYVAHTSGASASIDGNDLIWADQTGATCISVAAKPADGTTSGVACYGFSNGVIKRTTDACATALSTVYTFPSASAVNYIAWDWRNTQHVWAISEQCELAVSADGGATFGLYGSQGLRTTLGLAGALGNRIGLPGAGGVYIFGGNGAGTPLIAYNSAGIFGATGTTGWVQVIMTGDAATDFPADATMRIVDYSAPGFADGTEVMLLSWSSGGGASITAAYSTVSPPGPSRAFTRASTTFGGLKTGRYVVGDNPLTTPVFHLAFANRDVWDSTDGIAWTQKANVLPAGETPNFALFMSDVLTGIDGLFGVYMIATENAGGTLALRKSSDGITTTDVVRGTGAASTAAPAGYKPKMIAVGAPGNTVTSGGLARIGAANVIETFDGSSNWTQRANAAGNDGAQLIRHPLGPWYFIDDPGDDGDLYYSADGITFAAVLTSDANRGVYGVDYAADGSVYAVMGRNETANGTQTNNSLKVYRATGADFGSFALIHTDPGWGASKCTRPLLTTSPIVCSKTDTNLIFIGTAGQSTAPECIYSNDAGTTFTQRINGTPDDLPSSATLGTSDHMQFVNSGRIVYMAANGHTSSAPEMWTSDDLGATWDIRYTHADSTGVGECLLPYRSTFFNRMLVGIRPDSGADTDLYKSEDNGTTWTNTGASVTYNMAALEYDPSGEIAYCTADGADETSKIAGAFSTPVVTEITFNQAADIGAQQNTLAL